MQIFSEKRLSASCLAYKECLKVKRIIIHMFIFVLMDAGREGPLW